MSATWAYLSSDGVMLASVRREDAPPVGYPVRIGGDGGKVRHYVVTRVDDQRIKLFLEEDTGNGR
jgi:hypothetical protein